MIAEPRIADWLRLVTTEYQEMPGLSLTRPQMQRLWGMDPYTCEALTDALVAARVLRRTLAGTYVAHGASA